MPKRHQIHLSAGRVALFATLALLSTACGASTMRTVTRTETKTVTVTKTAKASTEAPATTKAAATTATSSSTAASAAPPAASPGDQLTVQDFNGNTLAVTAAGLIDPASPTDQFNTPTGGTRLVAAVLRLSNRGPGNISSDANSNATLIGTDGQAYTPSFKAVSECTNFNHGVYTLLSGDSERGCVVFQLPDGVNVRSVQFSLGNGTVQFNNG